MNSSYYHSRFLGAKRIVKINPEKFRFEDLISGVEEETVDNASRNDSLNVGRDERISLE
jgi:peptidoglycan endopeptidase LytE